MSNSKSSVDKLKLCPFCASHPTQTEDNWVWCSNDGCIVGHKGSGVPSFAVSDRRWNKRPIEDELEDEITSMHQDAAGIDI